MIFADLSLAFLVKMYIKFGKMYIKNVAKNIPHMTNLGQKGFYFHFLYKNTQTQSNEAKMNAIPQSIDCLCFTCRQNDH